MYLKKKLLQDILNEKDSKKDFEFIKKSLSPLDSIISTVIRNKMAIWNISFNVLVDTFLASGADGINVLFTDNVDGKPRVTKSRLIISNVTDFLENLF